MERNNDCEPIRRRLPQPFWQAFYPIQRENKLAVTKHQQDADGVSFLLIYKNANHYMVCKDP
jgi:hypothetical protein